VRFEQGLQYVTAITTLVSIPHWCDLNREFHSGSRDTLAGFNPTLVRFELLIPAIERVSSLRFNPTLVRFELNSTILPQYDGAAFQSHIGAI